MPLAEGLDTARRPEVIADALGVVERWLDPRVIAVEGDQAPAIDCVHSTLECHPRSTVITMNTT